MAHSSLPAAWLQGRFDREIYFPLPSPSDRAAILRLHTAAWAPPPAPTMLQALAKATPGFAGADLAALAAQVRPLPPTPRPGWASVAAHGAGWGQGVSLHVLGRSWCLEWSYFVSGLGRPNSKLEWPSRVLDNVKCQTAAARGGYSTGSQVSNLPTVVDGSSEFR